MCVKREELAAVGVTMADKEYQSAIIKSLLEEMSKFASGLLTAARVLSPTTSIDPAILIDHISEEADQLAASAILAHLRRASSPSPKARMRRWQPCKATEGGGGRRESATIVASKAIGPAIASHRRRTSSLTPTKTSQRDSLANSKVNRQLTKTLPRPRTSLWDPQMPSTMSRMGDGLQCSSAMCLSLEHKPLPLWSAKRQGRAPRCLAGSQLLPSRRSRRSSQPGSSCMTRVQPATYPHTATILSIIARSSCRSSCMQQTVNDSRPLALEPW
jgi:hypothetical protein